MAAARKPAVFVSGGADSALVAKVAADCHGREALLLTARSPSLSRRAALRARTVAEAVGLEHVFVDTDEVTLPAYRRNGRDRCFFCKMVMYGTLARAARSLGRETLLDGQRADDDAAARPGMAAADRFGVVSPLRQAGLGRRDVVLLSETLRLPSALFAPDACLSSRIETGIAIEEERLRQVEEAEAACHRLGFELVRVRYHGAVARLEVAAEAMGMVLERRRELVAAISAAGFERVTLDLLAYGEGR